MIDTIEQVKVVSLLGSHYPLDRVAAGIVLGEGGKTVTPQPPHACDCGELGEGIASLAVPLRKSGGETCGALCLVGPEFRFSAERIARELLPNLEEAGEVISSKLGFIGPYAKGRGTDDKSKPLFGSVPAGEQIAKRDRSGIIL
jgi:hypothetical protein